MSLLDALGYMPPPSNPVRRIVRQIASTRPMTPLMARSLEPLDKLVLRITNGSKTLAGTVAGIPAITLFSTGARTGERRSTVLTAIPFDGDIALVGTNWGGSRHPGWAYNLEAHPNAEVAYRGRTVAVRSSRLEPAQVNDVFDRATALYSGYASYRVRAQARDIKVFRLTIHLD